MTLEEAKKLEHGDRILIEAEARAILTDCVDEDGEVQFYVPNVIGKSFYCKASCIREKLEPRRAFEEGDIVKWGIDSEIYVITDIVRRIEIRGSDGECIYVPLSDIELVCAAEDRADRKEEA